MTHSEAASAEHSVGQLVHEPHAGAAVHQGKTALRQQCTEVTGRFGISDNAPRLKSK